MQIQFHKKIFLASTCLATLMACGGAKQQDAETPESQAGDSADAQRNSAGRGGPKMQMQTELGVIDPKATAATFQRLQGKLDRCYKTGLTRIDYLEGDVKVFLRVGQEGTVKYGYLEDSTIGDRDTEKCMMDVLTTASWPKPDGGEAEVRNNFGFDAPGDVRPPTSWNADRLAEELGKNDEKFQKCKAGVKGSFRATAYVEPDGKQGKFQSLGIVPPSKEGVDKIDCLLDAIKAIKLPSPGSYAAKVSFVL